MAVVAVKAVVDLPLVMYRSIPRRQQSGVLRLAYEGLHSNLVSAVPDKFFNGEPVVFNDSLNNTRSSFFDHNYQHCAKVALRNLRQTGTILAYMQDFNQHTHTVGWAITPLMSYQHSLKENIQLAVVMSNIEFDSLRSMQALEMKAGQKIEGMQQDRPTPHPQYQY
ncbi:uncharacterized protein VP01_5465g1, partial [Puccinia sorghi]